MKIVIDARFFGLGNGIARYVEQLVLNLEKLDFKNEYFILINKEKQDKYRPRRSNFKKIIVNIPWYGWQEQIKMPLVLKKINPDLVHFPHFNVPFFYNRPFIVSIHDLIMNRFSNFQTSSLTFWKYLVKRFFYKLIIRHAIKKSKIIITMADFTLKEIANEFKIPSLKIKKIYEGLNNLPQSNRNNNSFSLKKYGINRKFVLYVGNAYPHKNLKFLINAFQKIKDNYQLVLIGKKDYFYQRLEKYVQNLNLINRVIFTDYVDDQELVFFYQNAFLYVFPSLYEGFGFPPLEAMQFGLPVLSSNLTSLPEILKDSVLYFNPNSEDDFLEKFKIITQDLKLRSELISNFQYLSLKYDWQITVQKTLNVYQSVLKLNS